MEEHFLDGSQRWWVGGQKEEGQNSRQVLQLLDLVDRTIVEYQSCMGEVSPLDYLFVELVDEFVEDILGCGACNQFEAHYPFAAHQGNRCELFGVFSR